MRLERLGSGAGVVAAGHVGMAVIREVLGTPVGLWPFSEQTGTVLASKTVVAHDATPMIGTSAPVDGLASFAIGVTGQGGGYVLNLDGTSEYLEVPDHADYTFISGANDIAFSVGALIYMDNRVSRTIISKYNVASGSEAREWRLATNADGKVYLELYDESVDATISKTSVTAQSTSTWYFIVATYSGSGVHAGITLYADGAAISGTGAASGSYVAMENLTGKVGIGAHRDGLNGAGYFAGKIALPFLAKKELSAEEVYTMNQIVKAIYEV